MASRLTPLNVAIVVLLAAGCGGSSAASVPSSASTSKAASAGWLPNGPPSRAVVWAVGDGGGGSGANAVAGLVARGRPDLFLYLGDVYPFGTAGAFRNGYAPSFGRFAKRTAPTPGNHDWPFRSSGYDPYWKQVQGQTPPPYYSLSSGGWQLISLNSETGDHSAQQAWLKTQLQAPGDCRLAFWHKPRFSGGMHGDSPSMDPYWRALQGHASLVVSGHDHDMQRFHARGTLTQLVSGAGGESHYAVDRSHSGLAFANDTAYGALRLDLRPGIARVAFYAANGRKLDSTTVRCRRS
jgi:hypothetical protein